MAPILSPRCFSLIAIFALLYTVPTAAGNVQFPASAAAAKQAVMAECPSCLAGGVTLCGTADVGFGKQFVKHFFAGKPKRGYLPGFRMSGEEFRGLARSLTYETLNQTLRDGFASLPLVIVDGGFAAARVLGPPAAVEIAFPPALHQCVRDAAKPWGCCIAADCRQECCEKSLGSPHVALRWDDAATGDKLTFFFNHTLGGSTLTRETGAGKKTVYWCLTEEPGWIQ